jgi:hypothetical protein
MTIKQIGYRNAGHKLANGYRFGDKLAQLEAGTLNSCKAPQRPLRTPLSTDRLLAELEASSGLESATKPGKEC